MRNKTYSLVVCGLLVAVSIVLTRIFSAEYVVIGGIPGARLGAGFVPVMLAGIILGPYYGMAAGAAADVIGFLLFPKGPYFFGITITSMLVGLLPYILLRLIKGPPFWARILVCVGITQISCSLLLQTFWLSVLTGTGYTAMLLLRAPAAFITIPVFYILIHAVLAGLRKARLLPENSLAMPRPSS